MTCIRVIAILTLIRQLCKPILHESKIKLHEFRANRQTFFGHKLEVFICQSSNYKPPTSPQATSRRQSQNWSKASRRATNSRLYWGLRVPARHLRWRMSFRNCRSRRWSSPTTRRLRRSYTENSRRCSRRMQWSILSPNLGTG